MGRLRDDQAGGLRRQRQLRVVKHGRWRGAEVPRAGLGVEDIGHRFGERVVEVHRRQAENFLNGAEEIEGVVLSGDEGALLHVGAGYIGGAAVGVNVVAAILGIVLDDEDERVIGVDALGDLLNEHADRVVVIGDLRLGVLTPSMAVS